MTRDGETPTRRNDVLRLLQRWSRRADHRLVFSVTGKLPRMEFSPTKDAGSGAMPSPLPTDWFGVQWRPAPAGNDGENREWRTGAEGFIVSGQWHWRATRKRRAPKSKRFRATLEAEESKPS